MFTYDVHPSKTGRSVLALASELSELAAKMAKDKGITPKDARLALELASKLLLVKKETSDILAGKISDAITEIKALQLYNPVIEEPLKKLIAAVDDLLDEK
ncbi:hypothetical protein [Escherichia coli]|uniref:hypothetical protein n=1 Tax=Escherichia coli TaxID=562 RepID=UPI001918ECB8|nr:hypothetical protein [Escherichia coli]CAD6036562.1 Uncharacterised protein [Escherichia coli]CAD6098629.1 Uncharacterised protein [Escherichia coli]CAD6176634.1 Uncharacterised protein [Escherichia coli]